MIIFQCNWLSKDRFKSGIRVFRNPGTSSHRRLNNLWIGHFGHDLPFSLLNIHSWDFLTDPLFTRVYWLKCSVNSLRNFDMNWLPDSTRVGCVYFMAPLPVNLPNLQPQEIKEHIGYYTNMSFPFNFKTVSNFLAKAVHFWGNKFRRGWLTGHQSNFAAIPSA